MEKRLKTRALGLETGPGLQCEAWRSATRGRPTSRLGHGLVARSSRGGGPWRRSGAHVGRTHGVVTARWPRAQQRGGVAGLRAPADKVSRKRRREHREGGGNTPDKVAVERAHPSSGSTCGGGAEAARRCPTVAKVLRSRVARSCSAGGEGRG
jgi:hypothetical protein